MEMNNKDDKGSIQKNNNRSMDGLTKTGRFIGSPVEGLSYRTATQKGKTDENGTFKYLDGEIVTFFIGNLILGSAKGSKTLSPLDIVSGASNCSDQRVINLCVLLQTIDQDGDLKTGIKITPDIYTIVSTYSERIDFNQEPIAFAADTNVSTMLAELNKSKVFPDIGNLGNRSLRNAKAAQAHLEAAIDPPTIVETTCRKVVETTSGRLNGFVTSNETWTWLGIPYAKPPLGDLRWKPPQPLDSWTGIRDCTQWGNQSPQGALAPAGFGNPSEDCLNLNVVAPADIGDESLPVMVWFHGGGFHALTANSKIYNHTALPQKGIVLVSVNHRLGPLGYMAHPELSKESEHHVSGNYGQLDLIAALNWIQKNISAFGGDPNCVTIFGESGGGGKVFNLMISPLAKGLFHRAIIQSGVWSISEPLGQLLGEAEARGESMAIELDVSGEKVILTAMRTKSWQEIVTAAEKINFNDIRLITIDGWYLTDSEVEIISKGLHNDVPLIIGANSTDIDYRMIEGVKDWGAILSANSQSKVYTYIFGHVPTRWRNEGVVSFHGLEIPYVFGAVKSGLRTPTIIGLARTGGAKQWDPGIDDMDTIVSENMMDMWIQFAATGDPNIEGQVGGMVEWSPYKADSDNYLYIGDVGDMLQMREGILEAYVPPPDGAPPLIPVK